MQKYCATQPAETQAAELSAKPASRYRAWAELLKRTFDIDVLECPKCHGRMKLLAMITDGKSAARYLTKLGEPTSVRASTLRRKHARAGAELTASLLVKTTAAARRVLRYSTLHGQSALVSLTRFA